MMNIHFKIVLYIVVGLIGFCVGAFVIKKFVKSASQTASMTGAKNNDKHFHFRTYDELIKTQVVYGTLDISDVMGWFRENAKNTQNETAFILGRPTEKVSEMLAISPPPSDLDAVHTLLQAVVDKKKMVPICVRMICFTDDSDKVETMMNGKDCIFVQD